MDCKHDLHVGVLSTKPTFIDEFLLRSQQTLNPNISIKLKLKVVITIDEQYRPRIVYFEK